MRHWWLMAIHALPYQMETINELFSLLYAGHTEKGTEQGWANLKQCRRLDACLGQTRINSFGLMGEAQRAHRIKHWHREESPQKLWGAPGSPHLSSRFAFSEDHRRNAAQQSRKQSPHPWLDGETAAWSYRPLSNASQDGSMTGQDISMSCQSQCQGTVPAPAKSRVSRPHPWAGGPVGERTSHPGQPRKGCEYYTVERLLATLTHLKTFHAVCRLWGRGAAGPLAQDGFGTFLKCTEGKTHQEQTSASKARSDLSTHRSPAASI